jgi:hypothetical protein
MTDKLQKIFEQFAPFLILGVAIAIFFVFLFILYYVFLWGILIGGILWLIAMAYSFFTGKSNKPVQTRTRTKGRIIEHEDTKK